MAVTKLSKRCPYCEQEFLAMLPEQRFCSQICARLGRPKRPVSERFWSKVDTRGPDDCWLWKGSIFNSGYGHFSHDRKSSLAHRFSWILANGEIPKGAGYHGTCVLHRCDNPPCVNPSHLFLGSNDDNMADKVAKDRQAKQRGELCPTSKLTTEAVLAIRAARGLARQKELGLIYGVSRSAICMIQKRTRWAHV